MVQAANQTPALAQRQLSIQPSSHILFYPLTEHATFAVNAVEDVVLAIRYGLDGIIISNHGGRQFDGVPATLDTLRECAPVAAGHIPIAIDGGIRRGSDIFKAIALGAQHCFVGRVPIWGLAVSRPTS